MLALSELEKLVGFEPQSFARNWVEPASTVPSERAVPNIWPRREVAFALATPVGQLKFDKIAISLRLLGVCR